MIFINSETIRRIFHALDRFYNRGAAIDICIPLFGVPHDLWPTYHHHHTFGSNYRKKHFEYGALSKCTISTLRPENKSLTLVICWRNLGNANLPIIEK